jgi:glycosyltransferase involved in cell wall biosynthesis
LTETHYHPQLKIERLPLDRSDWIGFALRAARRLDRLNRLEPFDVVHFWDVYFACAYRGHFVASIQHSFRQRLVHWDWSQTRLISRMIRFGYFVTARYLAEVPPLRRADGLLAGSAAAGDEYRRYYRLAPERIALAAHGIDTDFFQPNNEGKLIRRRLGLADDVPVLLFVGFFNPRKGLPDLAQAFAQIDRPTGSQPRLVIVGNWYNGQQSSFSQMLGPAADRVIYAGYVPDEQMPCYFSMADVYVSASLLEGFGLPLAEALACGTPVAATEVGSVAEVVGPGGVLTPPHQSAALARAIADLLADPLRRQDLGQQGRWHIIQHFSLQNMVESTLAAYQTFAIKP